MLSQFYILFKFSLCGIIGVIINFSITAILKEILKINLYLANTFGIITALTVNFLLNKFWTFYTNNNIELEELIKFITIMCVSVIFNNLIVFFFSKKIKLNFYHSKIMAVLIVFVWNFIMHQNYTFK
tara:strand:- start:31 stop:411 length:381 start_codon:yes stop_codon:yes gene_type:complete